MAGLVPRMSTRAYNIINIVQTIFNLIAITRGQSVISETNKTDKVIKIGILVTDRGDWWRWQDLSAVGAAVNFAVEDFVATGALPDYDIK